MKKYVFIGFIGILTLWTMYIYYEMNSQDSIELQRIKRIEEKYISFCDCIIEIKKDKNRNKKNIGIRKEIDNLKVYRKKKGI